MFFFNFSNPKFKRSAGVRLLKLILPHGRWIFFSIVCMGGYTFFNTAPAIYIKDIVDTLAYGPSPALGKFIMVGLGIIAIFSLKGLFYFGQTYGMGYIAQKLLAKIRSNLFAHLQSLSLSYFSKTKTGDLVSRFTNDLQVLQSTLQITVTGPFRDIPQVFVLLVVMFYRSWQLALVTFTLIPLALFCIRLFGRLNKNVTRQRQHSFGSLTSLLVENITGMKVVKAFGMEPYEIQRFEDSNEELHENYMKSVMIASYASPIIEVIGATTGALIVSYGGYIIIHSQITAGDFASFLVSFFMLNEPIKHLNGFNLKLQEGLAAVRCVFQVMDSKPEIQETLHAKVLTGFDDSIKIEVQDFRYLSHQKPSLHDIHLEVKKGEIIALVGSSGAGKTSLVNLIPRFYDPSQGRILIDGQDLRDVTLKSLRSLIAIVTQETILFNDTIATNISYGDPTCDQAAIMDAAKAANAHDFIMAQPRGYQTVIGEKGVRLSGGQRQRISIARALVKNAPILILDEATSSLDSESEKEVQQAIENLMEHRTTFVIAHRLSTIRHAHRICVMENGRVVEQGPHETLLQQNGRYRQLYHIQFENNSVGL